MPNKPPLWLSAYYQETLQLNSLGNTTLRLTVTAFSASTPTLKILPGTCLSFADRTPTEAQTFRQHPDVGLHTALANACKGGFLQSQMRNLCFQIRAVLVLTGNLSHSNDSVCAKPEEPGLQKRKGRSGV